MILYCSDLDMWSEETSTVADEVQPKIPTNLDAISSESCSLIIPYFEDEFSSVAYELI